MWPFSDSDWREATEMSRILTGKHTDMQGVDRLVYSQTLRYGIAAETILSRINACYEGPGPPEGTEYSKRAFLIW